jgi:hypothetical protein
MSELYGENKKNHDKKNKYNRSPDRSLPGTRNVNGRVIPAIRFNA